MGYSSHLWGAARAMLAIDIGAAVAGTCLSAAGTAMSIDRSTDNDLTGRYLAQVGTSLQLFSAVSTPFVLWGLGKSNAQCLKTSIALTTLAAGTAASHNWAVMLSRDPVSFAR